MNTPAIQIALGREYAAGLKHGFQVTLALLLGKPTDGGVPYTGPVPPELRAWAEDAQRRAAAVDTNAAADQVMAKKKLL